MTRSRVRPSSFRIVLASTLLVVLGAISPVGATAAGWHGPSKAVDRTPSTATVDDTGKVHVVSESGQGLRYTTNRTGEWKTVRLSQGGSDREPSIALSGGKVYIAYARIGDATETNGARSVGIYLVTNRTGEWTTTHLTHNEGVWPSIRVRAGQIHVAYLAPKGVRYLTDRSGHWTDVRVWTRSSTARSAYYGIGTSLVLDSEGHARIAFSREASPSESGNGDSRGITYATNESGSWRTRTVTSGQDRIDRIALDPSGRPVIGYERGSEAHPSFHITTIGWTLRSRTLPGSGQGSFTLDSQGRLEVVRYTSARLDWYAQRGATWLHRGWSTGDTTTAIVRITGSQSRIVFDDCCGNTTAVSTTTFLLTRR